MQNFSKLFFVFLLFVFLKNEFAYSFVANYLHQQLPFLVTLPHEYQPLEIHAVTRQYRGWDVVALENFLYREQLHPFLALQVTKKTQRNFDVYRWQLRLKGKPLCHNYFVSALKSDKTFYVNGKLPPLTAQFGVADAGELPSLEAALAEVERYFPHRLVVSKLLAAEVCWQVVGDEARLVWEIQLKRGMRRWFAQADADTVYYLINNDLHVEKEAFVYYPNIEGEGEIVTIDTDEEGFLHNCCFHSLPYGKKPLVVDSDAVRFAVDDRRYAELAAYVFANRMLEFFQGLGYRWQDRQHLQLSVHAQQFSSQQLSSNARYEPASVKQGARIMIADGDNYGLKNLPLDFDVVAHEFSHHVIYRTLKARSEPAIALHEGLADYFTYAATGDSCLGETICPQGSPLCYVDGQCLRTADNDLRIEDGHNNHAKGQAISALLWDLHTQWGIAAETVLRIVYDTVALLDKNSDFRAFALTLLHVAISHGDYSCMLVDEFHERGLLLNVDCQNFQPKAQLTAPLPPLSEAKATSSNGCGVIGQQNENTSYVGGVFVACITFVGVT